MSDLKPCPFCGSEHLGYRSRSGMKTGRFVRCADCDACGPLAEDDALARAAWNEVPRKNEVLELPRDADGVLIRLGDVMHSTGKEARLEITTVEFSRNGSSLVLCKCGGELSYWKPEWLAHVKPDSLESIEDDIYHLVMSEYLEDPQADVKAIMERIKKLTKEGEQWTKRRRLSSSTR